MTWEQVAADAKGWLHSEEGPTLHDYASTVAARGPLLEVGGYCGKSACWLGAAAAEHGSVLFSVDWHRGSPEMEAGRECHDADMLVGGLFDSLPHFRATVHAAGLEPFVVPVVGLSSTVGRYWSTPLAFVFIDGAHDAVGVLHDSRTWGRHVIPGGLLAFHDIAIPGIEAAALAAEGEGFTRIDEIQSLRILRRPS